MSKDDLETQCMNELFKDEDEQEEIPYYNHWRPVAYCDYEGNIIRKLTKEEQLEWIKKQKEQEK